ncbi:MAG: transglutaminase domain-containing protein, partial [Bryobacteraceae bacterium]
MGGGAALTHFDGKKWFNPSNAARLLKVERGQVLLGFDPLRPRGRNLVYRVDLRAIDSDVLFLAGLPERLNYLSYPSLIQTEDDGFRLGLAPPNGVRYEVSSYQEPDLPLVRRADAAADVVYEAPAALRRNYLQLPPLDPRIPVLARNMAAGYPAPLGKAQAIEDRLRRDFGYTLDLPSKEVADPLAHFLFERKKGHCEYFASSMTVMLRTLGIPARLVNGFQSGTYNPISDQFVIRASDAHSWVEAYLPGRGWTTFDPTPPDPSPRPSSLLTTLMLFADAAETFWQEWVVGYNQGRQVTLAEKIGHSTWRFSDLWREQVLQRSAGWARKLVTAWEEHNVAAVALFSLGMATLLAGPNAWKRLRLHGKLRRVRRGIASSSDATMLYQQFLETFRKKGFEKPPWYTAVEFARTLERSNAADLARNFTEAYNEFRFGGRTANAPRLSLLLDEVKKRGK